MSKCRLTSCPENGIGFPQKNLIRVHKDSWIAYLRSYCSIHFNILLLVLSIAIILAHFLLVILFGSLQQFNWDWDIERIVFPAAVILPFLSIFSNKIKNFQAINQQIALLIATVACKLSHLQLHRISLSSTSLFTLFIWQLGWIYLGVQLFLILRRDDARYIALLWLFAGVMIYSINYEYLDSIISLVLVSPVMKSFINIL